MKLLRSFFALFCARCDNTQQSIPREADLIEMPPITISEWDNLWNRMACELAKPRLNPEWKVDEELVNRTLEQMKTLDPDRYRRCFGDS